MKMSQIMNALKLVNGVIFLSLTCGCQSSSPKIEANKKLSKRALYSKLLNITPNAIVADDHYLTVDMNWLKSTFNKQFFGFQVKLYSSTEQYDCDDYARLYCAMAQMTSKGNIAIGEFWYMPSNSSSTHAVVVVCTSAGLHFIEPQTGCEIYLSKEEMNTCSFLRI